MRWPGEQERLDRMRDDGIARLVLVAEGAVPPLTTDVLEDWIRLPASGEDIESRLRVLHDRCRANGEQAHPSRGYLLEEASVESAGA